MTPRFHRVTTAALLGALSLGTAASASYVQLIDLPSLQATGGGNLVSTAIDGNQGYALLNSSGGSAQIVRIDDIGGANNVSTLTDLAEFSSAAGTGITNLSGSIFDNGNSLYLADNTNDIIWTISKATGGVIQLIDIEAAKGITSGSLGPQFGAVDIDSDLVYYEFNTDELDKSNGFLNGFSTVLTDTELTTITGDDSPTGLGISSSGVYYLGQGSSGAGEDISFYDPSDGSFGTFLDEAAVAGPGNDVSYSTTAFTVIGETLYARDGGTNDRFISIDLGTGTVTTILDETDLTTGPALSDFAQDFSLFNGELAWSQTIGAGGQVPGIYAVPEPATFALAGLGALAMLRRRSA
ncbi:MAG: PEP-CTERM sorting domain-containing protein [Planctomycetota bacterium]